MAQAQHKQVIGRWRKLPGPPCAAAYPAELNFLDEAAYIGRAADDQGFTLWGGGDYELLSDGRIRLQTQTDEMVTYRMTLAGDSLQFEDQKGCRVAYRRSKSSM